MRELNINELAEISGGGSMWGDNVGFTLGNVVWVGMLATLSLAGNEITVAGFASRFAYGAVAGLAYSGVTIAAHTYNIY